MICDYLKGNAAKIFKLRDNVVGGKKKSPEATVIRNPETNEIVMKPDEIKKVTLKFCKNLLTNRLPNQGYEEDINVKRRLHEQRMEEEIVGDVDELLIEMFNSLLKELWE